MSSNPGSVTSLSAQQARLTVDQEMVLSLGQFDTRLSRAQDQQQVDMMVTGANITLIPAVRSLAEKVRATVRPLFLQYSPPRSTPGKPPSVVVVVSQTRLVWVGLEMGLVVEVREVEARGKPANCDLSVTGVKMYQLGGKKLEEQMTWVQFPALAVVKHPNGM